MINVTLYRKENCTACDQAVKDLDALQSKIPHRLVIISLEDHPELISSFKQNVPFVEAGPYHLQAPFTLQDLWVTLGAANDRQTALENSVNESYIERKKRGSVVSSTDRGAYWFSNHYMIVFNLLVLLYVGLPFLAPVFMKSGLEIPARLIYKVYSPLCHQLAFRSWFLFGEQPFYPSNLAGVNGIQTLEAATGIESTDTREARRFIGNESLGYKVALCQRDTAMYGSIFLFGLLFSLSGRRIKPLRWYFWILIGILPIAIDGFSQLPSLMFQTVPGWLPLRESTPWLRLLTGFLFGFSTAWYGYPIVEESMRETRQILARKIAISS